MTHRRIPSIAILTVCLSSLALTASSCHIEIKEDRKECPLCAVVLKADPPLNVPSETNCYVRFWRDGLVGEGGIIKSSFLNDGYQYNIEKNVAITVAAVTGWPEGEQWRRGSRYVIPKGSPCPAALASFAEIFLEEDYNLVPLLFTSLTVPVRVSMTGAGGQYTLRSEVYGFGYPKMESLYSSEGLEIAGLSEETRVPRLDAGHALVIRNTVTVREADIVRDVLVPGGYDFSQDIQKGIDIRVSGDTVIVSFEGKDEKKSVELMMN